MKIGKKNSTDISGLLFYKRQTDAKVISTTVDSVFLAPSCFCDKIKTLPDPDYRMYHISYQDCDKNIACQFRMRYLSQLKLRRIYSMHDVLTEADLLPECGG